MVEYRWSLDLHDQNGSLLAADIPAAGRQLTFQRNTFSECSFALAHEDEAARVLLDALKHNGTPTLRAWRRGPNDTASVCRFAGHLAPFTEDLEEQAIFTPVFRSPFARLLGEGQDRGRFTGAPGDLAPGETVDFWNGGAGTDAGTIAASLINTANADGPTGLVVGTIESTKNRGRVYQYANVGEEVVNLSSLLDGFDFEEQPISSGGDLATFVVFAQQGTDAPSARFEYGPGTLGNVRSVSRTTEPPINAVRVLGANGLAAYREHADSIAKYGLCPAQISASDVDVQATLDDRAWETLRPNPVKTLSFTPEYGVPSCPRLWDDFFLGGRVQFFGRRGAFYEDAAVRLNAASLVIDDAGFESVEVPDPLDRDGEATLRASLTVEIL